MASITISRGTPFSAASWVMAVTNSLFMLPCPPLFPHSRTVRTTKEVGATHFVSVAFGGGSVWPRQAQVYHSYAAPKAVFQRARKRLGARVRTRLRWLDRPTCRVGGSGRPGARRLRPLARIFRRRLCRRTG